MSHQEVLCHGIYIDHLLYPIFNTFNNNDIKTLYSCQGDEHQGGYISFVTINDVLQFLKLINNQYTYIKIVFEGNIKKYLDKNELIKRQNDNHIRCVVEFQTNVILQYFK
jgi:hypothetical protein